MATKNDTLQEETRQRLESMIAEERTHARRFVRLDEEVAKRAQLVLAEADSSAKIAKMADELNRAGISFKEIAKHVLIMNPKTRETRVITPQGLWAMVLIHEERRPDDYPSTDRLGKQDDPEPAGRLNLDVLR